MPIYDFTCPACGKKQELLMKMDDDNPKCPICRERMIKQVSLSSFKLNGDGWYRDGYSGPSNRGDNND